MKERLVNQRISITKIISSILKDRPMPIFFINQCYNYSMNSKYTKEKWFTFKNTFLNITSNSIPSYLRGWIFTPPFLVEFIYEVFHNYTKERDDKSVFVRKKDLLEYISFTKIRFLKDPLLNDSVNKLNKRELKNFSDNFLSLINSLEDILSNDGEKKNDAIEIILFSFKKKNKVHNFKRSYTELMFKKIKFIKSDKYNKWNSQNVCDTQKIIIAWIGSLLNYGYSEISIFKSLRNVIDTDNYKDFLRPLLSLGKIDISNDYDVIIPIKKIINFKEENIKYIINNFNKLKSNVQITTKNDLLDEIWKRKTKNSKNPILSFFSNINSKYFYKVNVNKKLDLYSASKYVLESVLPKHTASLRFNSQNFLPEKNYGELIFEYPSKDEDEWYVSFNNHNNHKKLGLDNDFVMLAKYKVNSYLKKQTRNNFWDTHRIQILNKIFINKYRHDNATSNEIIASTTSIFLEQATKLFKTIIIDCEKSRLDNIHNEIIKLGLLNFKNEWLFRDIIFSKNKKYLIEEFHKQSLRENSIPHYISNEEFIVYFFTNREYLYSTFANNDIWNKYMYQSKFNGKISLDQEFLFSSSQFMKNYSIYSRNQYQHDGKRLTFFAKISAETLDNILTNAINIIVQNKITKCDTLNRTISNYECYFSEITNLKNNDLKKDFTFIKKCYNLINLCRYFGAVAPFFVLKLNNQFIKVIWFLEDN